jgi:hypothetical protein
MRELFTYTTIRQNVRRFRTTGSNASPSSLEITLRLQNLVTAVKTETV